MPKDALGPYELDDSGREYAERQRLEAIEAAQPASALRAQFALDNDRLPLPAEQARIDHTAKRDEAIIETAPAEKGVPRSAETARLVLDQTIESEPASE